MKDVTKKSLARAAANQAGFTIMELLIVLAIIALIMGVLVGPSLFGAADDAKMSTAKSQTTRIMAAYQRWSLDNASGCPNSIQDLAPYLSEKELKDPWGNEFVLKCGQSAPPAAKGFGVLSKGKDQREGSEDDIMSWKDLKKN